jgi:uncharacterized protein (TIGR03435 family)
MTIRQSKDPSKGQIAFMPGMGTLKVTPGPSGVHIEVSNLTTSHFAQLLTQGEDRVVVDKTGLKGSYEASIDISMDGMQGSAPPGAGGASPAVASTPAMNPMFLAVEQLGLRIEPQKDVVDMLVIDHIEKAPTDN